MDIDKLIRTANCYVAACGFGSLMDIDKLIHIEAALLFCPVLVL